ncbi:MAG: hypothetical protein KAS11_01285, partial [Candidatus Aenigmarchaeota archaeon]|nr:hypothetical protein [Candidatus Aenigmarchaeota archaeon]
MTLKTSESPKNPEDTHEKFDYARFASNITQPHIQPYFVYFQSLRVSLKKADINMSLEDYISVAVVTSAAVFFFMALPLSILVLLITRNLFMSLFLSVFGAVFFSVL